jgi:F0F1-type ATP synthase delta subunit
VADMKAKGIFNEGQTPQWRVRVDPSIEGGVIFKVDDLLVDASVKSLRAQLFQNLDTVGIKRVE